MTNSRFEDLERRCQKLKRARIAKIVLLFASISFLIGGYFYMNNITAAPVKVVPLPTTITPAVENNNTSVTPPTSEEDNNTLNVVEENITQESEKQNYDTLLLAPKVKGSGKKVQLPVEENVVLAPPAQNLEMKDFELNEALKVPH
ncbi:MAG: hypothetical protein PHR87_11825, partial [Sulfurospirillaceae bacterium]|nr:hypothetical protein [Sulfurospirillaceae bacterium]